MSFREIQDAVRAARRDLGLTIEQAAEAADITPASWRYFERGRVELPDSATFRRICAAVGLGTDEMLSEGGYLDG